MNSISTWQQAIIGSWNEVWLSLIAVLPNIIGAITVFAVGLILAFWGKRIITRLLNLVGFNKLSATMGVEKYLKKADIKLTPTNIVGTVVEWIIILVFFLAVVDILGLSVVSSVLLAVLSYVPNIIAAVLIFAAGYIVAGIVDGLVRGALASVDHDVAKPLGNFARWLVLVIAFFAAVDQLKVAQGLINTFFQGLTYTLVLAIGLSVGLGAKDLVSKVLSDWYKKVSK